MLNLFLEDRRMVLGLSWGPPGTGAHSFVEIFLILLRFVLVVIFKLFRTKMMKCGWTNIVQKRNVKLTWDSRGAFSDSSESFYK